MKGIQFWNIGAWPNMPFQPFLFSPIVFIIWLPIWFREFQKAKGSFFFSILNSSLK